MCKRVIYLNKGEIRYDGPTDGGIALYEGDCRLSTLPWTERRPDEWTVRVTEIAVTDESGRPKSVFDHGERMRVRLEYEVRQQLEALNFIVAFVRSDGVACCNYSTETDGVSIDPVADHGVIELVTPPLSLVSELYTIHVLVRKKGFQEALSAQIGATFHVRHELFDTHFGVFHERAEWSVGGPEAVVRAR